MQRRILLKKFAFVLLITAVVTCAQAPASPKSKSDAEKIASARKQVQSLLRETQPCSTIQNRPAASSGFCGPAAMGGPVFRAFLEPPMMSPAALTRSFCSSSRKPVPVVRPICNVSEFHTCWWQMGTEPNESHAMGSGNEFHVGPHIMIIGL